MNDLRRATPARCLLVEAALTAALVGLVALALPAAADARPAPGRTFDELLVGGCAVAALVAAAWLWFVATVVVVEALRGSSRRPGRTGLGVPRAVRALVLTACGAALVVPMGAAHAESAHPSQALHGLPMPDRATSSSAWMAAAIDDATRTPDNRAIESGPAAAEHPARTHVVRPGDTLWSLAAADLSPTADDRDVTRRWHRLHDLNRAVIGDDPDLIHPGQRLSLPPAAHRGDPS